MKVNTCDKCSAVVPDKKYDWQGDGGEYPEAIVGSGGVSAHTYKKHKSGHGACWSELIDLDLCGSCLPAAVDAVKSWLGK